MMQEPVEDCGSEDAVVVEDLRPVFERAVGGDDDGAPLIALGDDLKEEIGPVFVDGQISQFVALCEAPHNSIYVESSLMLRGCRLGSLQKLSPAYSIT
jgi:hypothetical protein